MAGRVLQCFVLIVICGSALADLQNVTVGGQLRIRARYWDNVYNDRGLETRIPDFFLERRPIGPFGAASPYAFDVRSNVRGFVEQDTKLRISADFTDNVNAVFELDDLELWGRGDFRSDYRSGVDSRAVSSDDVEVLQSYVELNELGGAPLRLRIGRQQLKLGSGWLVGENQSSLNISFDGARATYTGSSFTLDGWAAKLAENGAVEEDGDVDFFGVSAACTAVPGQEFLVYWLYVHDGRSLNDTNFVAPVEWLEDVFRLDDYDATNLHTVGFRGAGSVASFDYATEVAYQFGGADGLGQGFAPPNMLYGDDDARFGNWAGDAEVGYTFEGVAWSPRVYVGGAYFGGEDNRDVSFREWLNPFDRPDASVSFNRLFSSRRYSELFDESRAGTNFYQIRAGVDGNPTERVSAKFELSKFGVNEPFDHPLYLHTGQWRIPVAPGLAFLTEESGDDIGVAAAIEIVYQYSDNLSFRFVWSRLFASEDVDEGSFTFANGLELMGGSASDDTTYVELETRLRF